MQLSKHERRRPKARKLAQESGKSETFSISASQKTFCIALGCSLLGGLILWAAFPPLNLWPLAWLAPLPWLYLILRSQPMTKWAYFGIWLGGFVHWLALLQGLRLAHYLLVPMWILLSAYVALYLPLFVGLSRVAVQRLRWSVVAVAPVVWVGLELVRGHLLTGFSLCLLAHTQASWPAILQIADACGAYGVSFVIMLVAACLCRGVRGLMQARPNIDLARGTSARSDMVAMFGPGFKLWPFGVAVLALAGTVGYGYLRLAEAPKGEVALRVALIQGSRDVHVDMTDRDAVERMNHYVELTEQMRRENADLDLVIWPESMFRLPEIVQVGPHNLPHEEVAAISRIRGQFSRSIAERAAALNATEVTSQSTPTYFWFCATTVKLQAGKQSILNTAMLADESGTIVSRYHKMRGVMFGEYVPFAKYLGSLPDYIPVPNMEEGADPAVAEIRGARFCPSICFESTIPHLIRRQVVELTQKGTPPDLLVNLTNDGWFYGSSILDHHFRCSVFRAIENRKPMLIAANTGISAHIDGSGRVLQQGPKRKPAILIAQVQADGRRPLYHVLGDSPAILCGGGCGVLLLLGLIFRYRDKRVGIVAAHDHESKSTGQRAENRA